MAFEHLQELLDSFRHSVLSGTHHWFRFRSSRMSFQRWRSAKVEYFNREAPSRSTGVRLLVVSEW